MRKVITYGTFDLFHQGHYNILKRAKEEGDYLIVGVTGESYDMERGKLAVQDSLATRVENVRKTGFADQIIVEEYLGQKISDILKYNVDVLVIGSDWKGKFDHLSKYCQVKYLERTKDISSTQLREERLDILNFGVVLDTPDDNNAMNEAKCVSGIHAESAFAEDQQVVDEFVKLRELNRGYTCYDAFLQHNNVIYVKCRREDRLKYAEQALLAGKHVVCDAPMTLDFQEELQLRGLAEEKGVVLLNNISTLHLQAFGPLLWMARGNLIGELQSVKCSISRKHMRGKGNKDFWDLVYYPLCVVFKIMGIEFEHHNYKLIRSNDAEVSYALLTLSYPNAVAAIEIAMDAEIEDGITILGSEGSITVPGEWWDIGYFTVKNIKDDQPKRYSFNYEGNGFRYLMCSMLGNIKNEYKGDNRISDLEAKAISKSINEMMESI